MIENSICVTHFNNAKTVSPALASIFSQIDDSFEVVVVDNMSNDGSEAILEGLAAEGRIRLVKRKCNRGEGRQVAFENSVGRYILANMDMDDTFRPGIAELLETYHRECEGRLLLAIADKERWSQNITIGTRELIAELGGWRNLQWGEDWDLWRRASRVDKYNWTTFALAVAVNPHEERSKTFVKLRQRYARYRDILKLGRPIFARGERASSSQRLMAVLARISMLFQESYDDRLGPFDPYDPSFFISGKAGQLTTTI